MTTPRQCFLADQDITAYVLDWGELDEIQSVLLAQPQLFVGQVTVKVDNTAGLFSPGNPSSPLFGQVELNQPVTLWLNGDQVFGGLLKDSEPDNDSKTADLVMENQFSSLAAALAVWTQAGANPAQAILAMLKAGGFGALVDEASFQVAAGLALDAGATVDLDYRQTDQVYLMQAVNDISGLAGLSVFVHNNIIQCAVFRPYQGDGSDLRQTLSAPYVRSWGTRQTAYNTFYNRVTVAYGSASTYTANDLVSQALTKSVSAASFSTNTGQPLSVPDLPSAKYFAGLYLSRASAVREKFTVFCGIEFADAVIGYRYPVDNPYWGFDQKAFVVIETDRTLSDNGIKLTLASL